MERAPKAIGANPVPGGAEVGSVFRASRRAARVQWDAAGDRDGATPFETTEETRMGVRPLLVTIALIPAAAFLGAGPGAGAPPDAADKARMQGVWEMVENEVNGVRISDRLVRSWLLVVEGDVYNPGSGETSVEYTFRLDPTRTPKAIDLVRLRGSDRGKLYRGVYAFEGDTLTVCRTTEPDDDRPAGFGARPGSRVSRVVWKRRKAP